MADQVDITKTIFAESTQANLARIVTVELEEVKQADCDSIEYTIYLLDDADASVLTPVEGHSGVSLDPAEVIFDELQTVGWTVDATGYNFRHVPDITEHEAFPTPQRVYLIVYTILPLVGPKMLARFRFTTI